MHPLAILTPWTFANTPIAREHLLRFHACALNTVSKSRWGDRVTFCLTYRESEPLASIERGGYIVYVYHTPLVLFALSRAVCTSAMPVRVGVTPRMPVQSNYQ